MSWLSIGRLCRMNASLRDILANVNFRARQVPEKPQKAAEEPGPAPQPDAPARAHAVRVPDPWLPA